MKKNDSFYIAFNFFFLVVFIKILTPCLFKRKQLLRRSKNN